MVNINNTIRDFPKRSAAAHKGDFGHVLVVAGSRGYTGAAYFTTRAAVLSGSGLVTLAVGRGIYDIMASKLNEAMVRPFFETQDSSLSLLAEKELLVFAEKCNAVAIGPGLSQGRETQALIRNLINKVNKPMVVDADGINALAGHTVILKDLKSPVVLTPHAGEMSRLIGRSAADIQNARKDVALSFASEYNTVLVLKGHETVVASPAGDAYVNNTGNPGMATGGTGDVLTGMIAAFLAQGVPAFECSAMAVYFHGLAGDLAAKEKGLLSLTATDLLNKLPEVLKVLG